MLLRRLLIYCTAICTTVHCSISPKDIQNQDGATYMNENFKFHPSNVKLGDATKDPPYSDPPPYRKPSPYLGPSPDPRGSYYDPYEADMYGAYPPYGSCDTCGAYTSVFEPPGDFPWYPTYHKPCDECDCPYKNYYPHHHSADTSEYKQETPKCSKEMKHHPPKVSIHVDSSSCSNESSKRKKKLPGFVLKKLEGFLRKFGNKHSSYSSISSEEHFHKLPPHLPCDLHHHHHDIPHFHDLPPELPPLPHERPFPYLPIPPCHKPKLPSPCKKTTPAPGAVSPDVIPTTTTTTTTTSTTTSTTTAPPTTTPTTTTTESSGRLQAADSPTTTQPSTCNKPTIKPHHHSSECSASSSEYKKYKKRSSSSSSESCSSISISDKKHSKYFSDVSFGDCYYVPHGKNYKWHKKFIPFSSTSSSSSLSSIDSSLLSIDAFDSISSLISHEDCSNSKFLKHKHDYDMYNHHNKFDKYKGHHHHHHAKPEKFNLITKIDPDNEISIIPSKNGKDEFNVQVKGEGLHLENLASSMVGLHEGRIRRHFNHPRPSGHTGTMFSPSAHLTLPDVALEERRR